MTEIAPQMRSAIGATAAARPTVSQRLQRTQTTLHDAMAELYKSKTAFAGFLMLVFLVLACLATPYVTRYDPVKQNYAQMLKPPSEAHYLGTDRYGRDILSRTLWGGRRLVTIAVTAVVFGMLLGVPYGVLSGYYGGWADSVAMRIVDGLLAFPGILLYLLIVTLARAWQIEGIWNDLSLIFALGFAFMPEVARLSRGVTLGEREKEYVEAARTMGDSSLYIALCQILPNCISPLIVNATVRLGYTILIIAALSFLGLGTLPPTPDWGADLSAARDHMETHPLTAIFPGLAICYTVLAFNLFGDGLRDILDPRLAER
jgi:ABC-type dipeptide/oligopeptide/nickel transport system permease subunit